MHALPSALGGGELERPPGIEPGSTAWKAGARPIGHDRNEQETLLVYDGSSHTTIARRAEVPKSKKSNQKPQSDVGPPVERPYCRQLPTDLAAPIGQVMMDWAFFEMRLQELIFLALNISPSQGRLAVKSMPALEMYRLATDLFQLEGIHLPEAHDSRFTELARRRNLLAHGVWFTDGDDYILRDLTGTFLIDGKKVKRKIQPAGVPIRSENIKDLSNGIQRAISDTESIIQDVVTRRSSSAKKHLG